MFRSPPFVVVSSLRPPCRYFGHGDGHLLIKLMFMVMVTMTIEEFFWIRCRRSVGGSDRRPRARRHLPTSHPVWPPPSSSASLFFLFWHCFRKLVSPTAEFNNKDCCQARTREWHQSAPRCFFLDFLLIIHWNSRIMRNRHQ